jgi:hypothetical protein
LAYKENRFSAFRMNRILETFAAIIDIVLKDESISFTEINKSLTHGDENDDFLDEMEDAFDNNDFFYNENQ